MAIRFDKFTVKAQQAIQQAQSRAAELGNPELQPVHLLLALIEDREGVIPRQFASSRPRLGLTSEFTVRRTVNGSSAN